MISMCLFCSISPMHLVKLNRNSPAGENDNLDSNSFSDSQPPPTHTLSFVSFQPLYEKRQSEINFIT